VSHYQDYKARFESNRTALVVPEDCKPGVPEYHPFLDLIDPHSWDFSWWLRFADKHYIVCHEIWGYRSGRSPLRSYFSFHYGPIVRVDKNGNIERDPSNPLELRICKSNKSCEPSHLHYKKPHPAPHYEQSRVDGLVLNEVDMFQFVKAVFRSRAEKIELDEAMGFTLR